MKDYERGARQSQRNEIRRREEQAPLLHATGLLPPMPSLEERIAQRKAAEAAMAGAGDRRAEESRRVIELYRETIRAQHGDEVLATVDAELKASHLAARDPAYHADFYCGRLAVLTGWQTLETFERVRGLHREPTS
jgi:hypothetical protein